MIITVQELKERLLLSNILQAQGQISITLNEVSVIIKSTDTMGNIIQEWLAQWMLENDIYFRPPDNTQNFPDFYLSESNTSNLVEIKSYYASRSPAFDVANFDSYCQSLRINPSRLDADYLIFAYALDDGILSIRNIYLKKVWQITGRASVYPLKCQRKKGQIYTIRPVSFNSILSRTIQSFISKEEFIAALYKTLLGHTNRAVETKEWLRDVVNGYRIHSGIDLSSSIDNYIRN